MFHVGLGYPVSLICVLLRFTMLYCVLSLYFMYWCIDLFSSTAARVFIKLLFTYRITVLFFMSVVQFLLPDFPTL